MKYDDASYHLGDSTPEEVAAAHIGLFFRWCLMSGLVSEEHIGEPELASQLKRVRDGKLSGAKYLWENTSGKLADVDLTEEGNRFSRKAYDKYCKQLRELVGKPDHQYREGDVDFASVKAWLDQELAHWRSNPPQKPWWRFGAQ